MEADMIKQMASAFVVAAAVGLGPTAEASVLYEFTAHSSFEFGTIPATTVSSPGESYTGSFSYLAPTFIIPDLHVPVGDLTSCSVVGSILGAAACADEEFLNSTMPAGYEIVSMGVNSSAFTGGIFYYFALGAFGTPGTHDTVLFGADQAGTLVVTVIDDVPEPGTLALLGASLIALAGFLRRRLSRARS